MFAPLPCIYELREQRYADFLREAEEARVAELATAHHSMLASRLLSTLGDLFISLGNSLKRRHQHEVPSVYMPMLQIDRMGEL